MTTTRHLSHAVRQYEHVTPDHLDTLYATISALRELVIALQGELALLSAVNELRRRAEGPHRLPTPMRTP